MLMRPRSVFLRSVARLVGLLLVLVMSQPLAPTVWAAEPLSGVASPGHLGQIREYRLPKGYGEPWAITTGPDGNLWFTDDGPAHGQNAIGQLNPRTGLIRQYLIPACSGNPPTGIVTGPDGNLWVLAGGCADMTLVRLHPSNGQMTLFSFGFYPIPGQALTVGPDGNLWLLEASANDTIDRFSLSTHSLTPFAIPTPDAQAYGLTSGPDGNLWFSEFGTCKLGRLNPTTGQMREYPLPYTCEGPETIIPGPHGDPHLWFVALEGFLGQIDSRTGQITQVRTPNGVAGPALSVGPDGNLWLADGGYRKTDWIGRATLSAQIRFTDFAIPSPYGQAQAITVGPDGNLWFTELYNGNHFGTKIGQVLLH